ncbi:nudix hydrolase 8-like [Mercurialis annua]|uniref:nudix hydrolase 8-like n=1 Tax=Mercurialis annua TaxID=3986 RepID=UPI0021605B89|nr:nudix hydrolase 8-like [Mercurialis annua]
MELKLVDSKSMSLSEISVMAKTSPNLSSNLSQLGGFRFSSKLNSCRGESNLKISCSSTANGAYLLKKANNEVENYLYHFNEKNNSNSTFFGGNRKVLDAFDDEYGGIIVDSKRLPENSDDFASSLHFSVSRWKLMGKKGIWLKLPLERSELVPVAVKEGFGYHHAEPGYVMLTYWLPEGPCMLPSNATHQVGVGGFVINDNNEVLVVQERFCDQQSVGLWKIPTGFIHESEEIYSGTVREVKEETGVDTEFIEVVAFRHVHNLAFDKSDLFFVCMLKSLSSQITIDNHEIKAAKWMPLEEFVKQPLIEGDSMFKKIIDICVARLGKKYCGLHPHKLVSKFDGRLSCLYYNVVDDQSINCSIQE